MNAHPSLCETAIELGFASAEEFDALVKARGFDASMTRVNACL
jgi:hypothetical protein